VRGKKKNRKEKEGTVAKKKKELKKE